MRVAVRSGLLALALAVAFPKPAVAGDKWVAQPVQVSTETVRYAQGTPTVELERENGIVRITPMPMDHGAFAFAVTVYNDGEAPANFGLENLGSSFAGKAVYALTRDDLENKAKSRAFWSQFGLALLGGTSSALAASQRDVYTSRWVTARGTYSSIMSVPSIAGQLQAVSLQNQTINAMSLVQYQLDRTLASLGNDTLQLTTVDPGESYGGRVVFAKVRPKGLPAQFDINVSWNGELYPFTFQIAKAGTPAPKFTNPPKLYRLRNHATLTAVSAPAVPPAVSVRAGEQAAPSDGRRRRRTSGVNDGFGNSHVRCVTCQ